MRYALILARLHGEAAFEAGPIGDPGEINEAFKKLLTDPSPSVAELHMLVSDQGVTKRKKFPQPSTPASASPQGEVTETPAGDTVSPAASEGDATAGQPAPESEEGPEIPPTGGEAQPAKKRGK